MAPVQVANSPRLPGSLGRVTLWWPKKVLSSSLWRVDCMVEVISWVEMIFLKNFLLRKFLGGVLVRMAFNLG